MKTSHYFITVTLSGVALVLGITNLVLGQTNLQLRNRIENNRAALQEGASAQQFLNGLLQDTAQAAAKDPVLEEFLKKNGIGIRVEQPPGTPGTSAPQPGMPPTTP